MEDEEYRLHCSLSHIPGQSEYYIRNGLGGEGGRGLRMNDEALNWSQNGDTDPFRYSLSPPGYCRAYVPDLQMGSRDGSFSVIPHRHARSTIQSGRVHKAPEEEEVETKKHSFELNKLNPGRCSSPFDWGPLQEEWEAHNVSPGWNVIEREGGQLQKKWDNDCWRYVLFVFPPITLLCTWMRAHVFWIFICISIYFLHFFTHSNSTPTKSFYFLSNPFLLQIPEERGMFHVSLWEGFMFLSISPLKEL